MTLRDQLIRVATVFMASSGLDARQVSRIGFQDGKTLPRVLSGGDVTTGTFERALVKFAMRWPQAAEWPNDVPRPATEAAE